MDVHPAHIELAAKQTGTSPVAFYDGGNTSLLTQVGPVVVVAGRHSCRPCRVDHVHQQVTRWVMGPKLMGMRSRGGWDGWRGGGGAKERVSTGKKSTPFDSPTIPDPLYSSPSDHLASLSHSTLGGVSRAAGRLVAWYRYDCAGGS